MGIHEDPAGSACSALRAWELLQTLCTRKCTLAAVASKHILQTQCGAGHYAEGAWLSYVADFPPEHLYLLKDENSLKFSSHWGSLLGQCPALQARVQFRSYLHLSKAGLWLKYRYIPALTCQDIIWIPKCFLGTLWHLTVASHSPAASLQPEFHRSCFTHILSWRYYEMLWLY